MKTGVRPFVYVALDQSDQANNILYAKEFAESVKSDRYGFKVNLDSIASFRYGAKSPAEFIRQMHYNGGHRPVFADLKMWNGGRTMTTIARDCAEIGVDIINIYPHAGGKFIRKVADALSGRDTKLFTLTVLTHYNDADTQKLYGMNLSSTVRHFAEIGVENGAHGIIVPGTQLKVVEDFNVLKLCPGIRPDWYEETKDNDQEQTVTPTEAVRNGATHLVVGSPIMKSPNKAEALERILKEIQQA